MANRKKTIPQWLAIGASCCGVGAFLSGCASSQNSTLSRMWETPPGVPAATVPIVPSPGPAESAPGFAQMGTPATPARKWTERTSIPERMLSAFGPRRTQYGDPFLADYLKEGAIQDGPRAQTQIASTPTIESIPLPPGPWRSNPPASAGPAKTGEENPFLAGSSIHPPGEQVPQLNPDDSQLTRLQVAMDFDRQQLEKSQSESGVDTDMKERVGRLMRQARSDMEEGRLAAALKTAQQAESLSSEMGLEFAEKEERPILLVDLLRGKLQNDIKDPTELPPEESVAFGKKAPPPDLSAPESRSIGRVADWREEPLPRQPEPPLAKNEFEEIPPARPAAPTPGGQITEDEVVLLAPPPDALDGDALRLDREPVRPTYPAESFQVATVVGPSSPLDREGTGPDFADPGAESGPVAMRYAALEPTTPFWPGRDATGSETEPGEPLAPVPATLGLPQLIDPVAPEENDDASSPRNISWRESPEAVLRINLKRIPKPLLAALAVAVVWGIGFALAKAIGVIRAAFRSA